MASETTFDHWKVVFSWGKMRKSRFSQNPLNARFWAFGFLIYTSSSANFKKNPPWYIFFVSVQIPDTSALLLSVRKNNPILIMLPNNHHACLDCLTLPLPTHPFDCSLVPPSQGDKCNQRQLHLLPEVENQSVSHVFWHFKMVQTWLKRNKFCRI